jgi:beta propeller repeat protein
MTKLNLKSGLLFATTMLFVALAGAPHANAIAGTERQITNDSGYQQWPAIYGDKIVWADDQGITDPGP